MKIKLILFLFLNLTIKSIFLKNFNFCEKICNYTEKKQKFIDFEIKKVKIKAKVVDGYDICMQDCKAYYTPNKFWGEILPENLKNICTNGKKPEDLTNKEYLKEFSKSSCSPLAVLPGIFGSRLEVEISNCYKFKQNYSDIYKICEFDECTNDKPWNVYNLWLTDFFTPMSIFSYREKHIKCFAKFMEVIYEFDSKNKNYKLVLKEGLKVKVQGLNDNNGKNSNCGIKACQNYAPINFVQEESKGFLYMSESLLYMGYKKGLTLQYLPYDFRLGYEDNDLNVLFKENIERLNSITFKKVVIVTHSLGGINALYQIKNYEKYNINKKIGNFITIAPPYFGAIKSSFAVLNLFSDYYYLNSIGIKKKENGIISQSLKSVFQMIPPNSNMFIKEKWFKWVQNRIDHEVYQDQNTYEKEGADLLPFSSHQCYNESSMTQNQCLYNFRDIFLPVLSNIFENKDYYLNEIDKMLKDYTTSKESIKLHDLTKNQDLFNYNPKIQHTFIFSNSVRTLRRIIYKRDISKEKFSDNYLNPDLKEHSNGDGTVPSFSVLFKAFKQSYEFEKEKEKGYKPVKLLELCSINKRVNFQNLIYDKHDGDHYVFDKNSYSGINCGCDDKDNKKDCSHSKLILDYELIKIISNLVRLNQKINIEEYSKFVDSLNEKDLEKYVNECPQLRFVAYGFNKFN